MPSASTPARYASACAVPVARIASDWPSARRRIDSLSPVAPLDRRAGVELRDHHALLAGHDLLLDIGHRRLAYQELPLLLRLLLDLVGQAFLSAILRSVCVFISCSGGVMSPMSVSTACTSYAASAARMNSAASACRAVRPQRKSSTV